VRKPLYLGTLILGILVLTTVPCEAKKKSCRKPKTTTAKVSQIVKQIGENNDGTLTHKQKGLTAASQGSQFDKWKNPLKMKVDPKLLSRGKKNKRNHNKKRPSSGGKSQKGKGVKFFGI
tara:strand:- start:2711 stop:3067 length:357 start_codon:yes stop_codon:yes gene_type:complete